MTLKEATLKSLEELKGLVNYREVYNHIIEKRYYDFREGKTPDQTVSATLGGFIRNGDARVKRVKGESGIYVYYLTKDEAEIDFEVITAPEPVSSKKASVKPERVTPKTYCERD